MAEKKAPKERKFVPAKETPAEKTAADVVKTVNEDTPQKTPKGRATGLRIAAVALWLLAVGVEVLAIFLLNGTLYLPGGQMMWLIIAIVLDLALIIIGSLLWKKANRIDPASEKNKVKFFLWNNMGIIAAVIAFLPLIVLLLKNKDLNPKTKKIVTSIAAVALAVAVAASVDYNPASQEDLEAAKQEATVLGDGTAYWTQWGRSYHFDPDCQTLRNSATIYHGTVEEAFEANRNDPCDFCAGGAEEKHADEDSVAAARLTPLVLVDEAAPVKTGAFIGALALGGTAIRNEKKRRNNKRAA